MNAPERTEPDLELTPFRGCHVPAKEVASVCLR